MKGITVLSLFDGMSCGQLALKKVGIDVKSYYASEIKPSALKVSKLNFPNTIYVGDVNNIDLPSLPKIDLLIGGSPCQDFSLMKTNGKGLEGDKSRLFYKYLEIKNKINPGNFLLENVKMKKESEEQLNKYLGVEGLHINSKLVSYQNRPRIYWTDIPGVTLPMDRKISFQYYKDTDEEYCSKFMVNKTPSRDKMWNNGEGRNSKALGCANVTNSHKVYCLTRKQDRAPNSGLIECGDYCRYLTRRELEQAQTVPIGYTDSVSINQAQDLLGDGWTVDVIAHILSFMK